LRVYTMRFADELVRSSDLDVPSMTREPAAKELEMAQRLIDTLAAEWDPQRYEDRHRDAVMAVIESKAAGRKVEVAAAKEPAPVPDLLAALTLSVDQRKARGSKTTAAAKARREPAAKPAAAAKTKSKTS
jgi:DNA end-binding protein Ku